MGHKAKLLVAKQSQYLWHNNHLTKPAEMNEELKIQITVGFNDELESCPNCQEQEQDEPTANSKF